MINIPAPNIPHSSFPISHSSFLSLLTIIMNYEL